ncbi:hypothetical protein MINTM003_20090 [Mycobacterium paraintracellulare]|nr:hypothetical protein MINTM003_20090 [Mycobacterium paraintracellulare]BCO88756.1 hypothetical protein MINTM015_20130 [Mycobacterium paraintracellulare]
MSACSCFRPQMAREARAGPVDRAGPAVLVGPEDRAGPEAPVDPGRPATWERTKRPA